MANLEQFKCMLVFCLKDWGPGPPAPFFVNATDRHLCWRFFSTRGNCENSNGWQSFVIPQHRPISNL